MARRSLSIARLRGLLLVLLLLAVVGIVGLFLFGRAGKQAMRRSADDGAATQANEGETLIGEDFDYTFTERERPIFRIRGESIRADRNGTIFLDGVALTIYDQEGHPYHAESREASFNRASNEGQLLGDVVLKGPGDLEIRTAQLQISQKGQVLVTPKPVEIRYAAQYVVHSDRLRVVLPDELYVLAGHTRVDSLPGAETPVAVSAERAVYERKQRTLRLEGGASLRRGAEQIQAQRLAAYLTDDEKGLTFVRAHWNVSGRMTGSGANPQMAVVRFSGRDLAVQMQPDVQNQPRKVVLEGGDVNRATLETSGAGVTRVLTALQIEGMLGDGVVTSAEAFGGIDLKETTRVSGGAGQKETRHATGMRTVASFRPDGQLASVELINKVTFRDPQVSATGNRASLDLDSGQGDFVGTPVEIQSERGHMTAPHVVYNVDHQVVNAMGGVRAVMEKTGDTSLAATPLGQGDGPVWVESREAFWRQQPSSFLFRGDVRSWRGENLLITTELKGDKQEDKLTATGGVKTLWNPTEKETAKASGKKAADPKAGAAGGTFTGSRSPVEVVSQELDYREGAKILIYTGNVRVAQEGKTINCDRLEVELMEGNQAKTMTCTGNAKVNDPQTGRLITGNQAVYHLDQRRVEVTGDKVTLRDKDGNQVQGKRVLYSVDDGKVEVKGKNETAAPISPTAPTAPTPAATATPAGKGSGG
jgi:lipopolysaccharide transport protein LptA/LPS export ABC transporter protein LptC